MEPRSIPPDEQAFIHLFQELHAPLVLFVLRLTGNQPAAEDIVEEAFIKLWDKRENFSQIRSLKAYLYTATKNAGLNWLAQKKRRDHRHTSWIRTEETSDPSVMESMIYAEHMARVYAALDNLPAQCRNVFTKLYLEGKSIAEISHELQIAENTVKVHRARGLIQLRKVLGSLILFLPLLGKNA